MDNAKPDARPESAEARAEYLSQMGKRGKRIASAVVAERKRRGMIAAVDWRESRRCSECGALAYRNCAHRDIEGPDRSAKRQTRGPHMPFAGHRTVAEVWEDEARNSIRRGLGR